VEEVRQYNLRGFTAELRQEFGLRVERGESEHSRRERTGRRRRSSRNVAAPSPPESRIFAELPHRHHRWTMRPPGAMRSAPIKPKSSSICSRTSSICLSRLEAGDPPLLSSPQAARRNRAGRRLDEYSAISRSENHRGHTMERHVCCHGSATGRNARRSRTNDVIEPVSRRRGRVRRLDLLVDRR
jgi:hypothetical protein